MSDPFFQEKGGRNSQKAAGSPAGSQTEERRGSERIPFCEAAQVAEPRSGIKLEVRVSDINLEGCYIDSMHVFPRGAKVQLAMRREGVDFKTEATVVYSLAGLGMGLHFLNPTPETESILRKWVIGTAAAEASAGVVEQRTAHSPSAPAREGIVLRSLVDLLIRKRVLTAEEGSELIQELQKR